MITVMHLISTDVFSGAENVACQIINGFKENKNYKMIYVSKIGSNKKSLDDRLIPYYELKKFNYKYIKKAIEEIRPDIIHAHDTKAIIMASLFQKKAKIIGHIHANHENLRTRTLKSILLNHFSKYVSKMIWISHSALKNYYYYSNIKDKSIILYNMINSSEILSKAGKDKNNYNFDIIYLGRMTYQKNPERFVKIVKKIKEDYPSLKVAMVGTGELDAEIQKLIKEYNLDSTIKFYGFKSNPYKILQSSKLMVMTSRYEGTPMCALEAFACHVPIISTPTDGLVDIINDGITGYLSDKDEEIVKEDLKLLNNTSYLKKMENNIANKNKEINNIDKYKKEIRKIYESI